MSRSNTIARATAVIAVFTLLSKILGFLREVALAYVFGASAATDAYLVAFTVPNVIFAVLGGALTVMAVPLFASYASAGKKEEAWRLFAVFSTLLGLVLLAVVLAGVPCARQIVWLVAPGLPEGTARLAASLLAVIAGGRVSGRGAGGGHGGPGPAAGSGCPGRAAGVCRGLPGAEAG